MRNTDYRHIDNGAPMLELRNVETCAVVALEHRFPTLEHGKTQLYFSMLDEKGFALYLIHPTMAAMDLQQVFLGRNMVQEGVQAWVDFPHPMTRAEVVNEMLAGLTERPAPRRTMLRLAPTL